MSDQTSLMDWVKALPQYVLPHYALSNVMHSLTRARWPVWKNNFTRWFIRQFGIDLSEAQIQDVEQFKHFNAFFTRELKPEARPIDKSTGSIISPVDGTISQLGTIEQNRLFQAKGRSYTLEQLLANDEAWVNEFQNGEFATIYLSPRDYHRIHMPVNGKLLKMTHVPGRLFSVNPATTRTVNGLFARNERVVCYFETELGPMAVILVGAIFVASMETVWHGTVSPPHGHTLKSYQYEEDDIQLKIGDELGRFNMGSTVILLFAKNRMQWRPEFSADTTVQMGRRLAQINTNL